ncbi:hypothetical protein A3H90_01710 [Candidatus Peribacteria bacterium RIFCSPLOWO2_02_FULL_55_36]|nr:MAG: hypothetical protein A3H90_01710 [Candidatus Peribacteria bacterium RIFCSPLOWO2_02_FULL_55_36]
MRSFESQSHVVWDCKYHVVIVPKYRKHKLYGLVRVQIGKIIRELAKQKEVEVLEGTACPDHMHMVLKIPPKHSVAYIILRWSRVGSAVGLINTAGSSESL